MNEDQWNKQISLQSETELKTNIEKLSKEKEVLDQKYESKWKQLKELEDKNNSLNSEL